MHNIPLKKLALSITGLLLTSVSMYSYAEEASGTEQLLQQIKSAESSENYTLVDQTLYRLESIAPDNPDVIAANIRRALRQQDITKAEQYLAQLAKQAPGTNNLKNSQTLIELAKGNGRDQLQQARLLARTGKLKEALALYDQVFKGSPPNTELAVEYWQLAARVPEKTDNAIKQLQKIESQSPGNPALRSSLANLLFSKGKNEAGFALLKEMAASPATEKASADMWLSQVKSMPVSNESVQKLQQYQEIYSSSTQQNDARQLLDEQKKQLSDPNFVNRQKGLALMEKGASAKALPYLEKAKRAYPKDADVIGAIGQAYSDLGNKKLAISYVQQAHKLDSQNDKWTSLIKVYQYWLLIQEGGEALTNNNLALAEKKYKQAQRIDYIESYAPLGLGNVARARKNEALAERYYKQSLKLDPYNSNAVAQLVNLYESQSPGKAQRYLATLSKGQRLAMKDIIKQSRSNGLQKEAESLAQSQPALAIEKLREAKRLTPDDTWLTYRLASSLSKDTPSSEADALFNKMLKSKPKDAELAYAYGLYLSNTDRQSQALSYLNRFPKKLWDTSIDELVQRLSVNDAVIRAKKMREQGQEQQAIEYIKQQPQIPSMQFMLADWAMERNDYENAQSIYRSLVSGQPDNTDALVGLVSSYLAQGKNQLAIEPLNRLDNQKIDSVATQLKIANAWQTIGDEQQAYAHYQSLRSAVQDQPPSSDKAFIYREIARKDAENNLVKQALDNYRYAMQAANITPVLPEDDDTFTQLTKTNANDDWLARSIRADVADLYQQKNSFLTVGHNYWGSSGTPGISDLRAHTTMLELDTPLYDGTLFARADHVQMNAGTFAVDATSSYNEKFGLCREVGCNTDYKQKVNGTSIGLGWSNDSWQFDLGSTPFGFEVVDWVGGLGYSTKWLDIGWTFSASRRPISSSLLSFAGTRDPVSGQRWGGVRASGGAISLSYDQGLSDGIWMDFSAHQITGKNVEDNYRVRSMMGYYHRIINENNLGLSIGLNNMLWHYQKDLSNYTLGQGGYYSPQHYLSFTVPVSYSQRTDNWSWELGASYSWSRSSTSDQRRYPIRNLAPETLADIDAMEFGSKGTGRGYTVKAKIERRLTSNLSIGSSIDIQKAKDYAPSHASVYLRYSFNNWRGNMDMPTKPLIPYADF